MTKILQSKRLKRTLSQICKTAVCLLLCLCMIFSYSIMPSVHAIVGVDDVVIGTIAVVGVLSLLGIGISATMDNTSLTAMAQKIWDKQTADIKAQITVQSVLVNNATQYWYKYSENAIKSIYVEWLQESANIDMGSLPYGAAHPAQFTSLNEVTKFLGITCDYNWLDSYVGIGSPYTRTKSPLLNCTDFKVLAVKAAVVDSAGAFSYTVGNYVFKFTGAKFVNEITSVDKYFPNLAIYCNGSLVRSLVGNASSGINPSDIAMESVYCGAPLYFVSYVYNSVKYISVIANSLSTSKSSPSYTFAQELFANNTALSYGLQYTGDDVINQANKAFYASEFSALNNKLDDVLGRLASIDGSISGRIPADRTVEKTREQTQTDTLGRSIADSNTKAKNDDYNKQNNKDTQIPKPSDLPQLTLPEVIFKEKFPFCLPWDFYNAFASLAAPAQPPKFVIPVSIKSANINSSITIDFSQFETAAAILRWGLSVIFVILLIMITRKLIGAGG